MAMRPVSEEFNAIFFPKIPKSIHKPEQSDFLHSLHCICYLWSLHSLALDQCSTSFMWVSPANQGFFSYVLKIEEGGGCSFQSVRDPAVGQELLFPSSDPPMPTFRQPPNQLCCSTVGSTAFGASRWLWSKQDLLENAILHSQNQAKANMLSQNWLWELPFGKGTPCPPIILQEYQRDRLSTKFTHQVSSK